jgi:uncharacterized protein (TIGR03437 family)
MHNWANGVSLPPPNELASQFNATFTRTLTAGAGATRAFSGVNAQWNVAGANGSPVLALFEVDINFYIDEPQYGVKSGLPPDVISVSVNTGSTPLSYSVSLQGSKFLFPISASLSKETLIAVNWVAVLQHLIDEGLVPAPVNGWSNSNALTTATFAGTEIANTANGEGGPMADLVVSDYEEGSVTITVDPAPVINSLSPSSAPADSPALNVTITGTGLVSGAGAYWTMNDHTTSLSTQFVDATTVTAQIPANLLTSPGTAQVAVANPSGYPAPSSVVGFTVTAAVAAPEIVPDGIISASAFGALTAVAPGSWIEIYGTNLAPDTREWRGTDFSGINAPTSLDGTSVSIGGQAAFVAYISPGQVNVQVPSTVGLGPQQVTVTNGSGTSSSYVLDVSATAPGLLAPGSFNIGGTQYVVALFPDNATYVLPVGTISGVNSRPAKPGDVIVLYGVGFGPVTPEISAGQLVDEGSTLTSNLQVLIGGTPSTLDYWGLAPGEIGLYQFNLVVPNVPAGGAVPFTFTLGGIAGTQKLYIPVQK